MTELNGLYREDFFRMVEIMACRTDYAELLESGEFIVPPKIRKQLTYDIAEWVLNNIDSLNHRNKSTNELKHLCSHYIDLANLELTCTGILI